MLLSDLPLPLLNYWVARALSLPVVFENGDVLWDGEVPADFAAIAGWELEPGETRSLNFAEDRALGHSVIEWIGISLERPTRGQSKRVWRAVTDWRGLKTTYQYRGPESAIGNTALLAAMRSLVTATFGQTVPEPTSKEQGRA